MWILKKLGSRKNFWLEIPILPRVFLRKSAELREKKRVVFLVNAKNSKRDRNRMKTKRKPLSSLGVKMREKLKRKRLDVGGESLDRKIGRGCRGEGWFSIRLTENLRVILQ